MRIDLDSYAPIGLDGRREAKWLIAGLILAALAAVLQFSNQYTDALAALYYTRLDRRELIPGAVMADFPELIVGCDTVFLLICLGMVLLAAYHYSHHYRGAKSIYLMRRLPDRWELHRRCLSIPGAGIVAALALLGLLGIVFYLIYILCTPAQCLPAG